jgi:hypothetical protein
MFVHVSVRLTKRSCKACKLVLNRTCNSKCGHVCHRASIRNFHHICVNACICECKRVSRLVWMLACVRERLLASRNWRIQAFEKASVLADKCLYLLVWCVHAYLRLSFVLGTMICANFRALQNDVRPWNYGCVLFCFLTFIRVINYSWVKARVGQLCRIQTSVLRYISEYKRSLFFPACLLERHYLRPYARCVCVAEKSNSMHETMRWNYRACNLCKKECLCASHREWTFGGNTTCMTKCIWA